MKVEGPGAGGATDKTRRSRRGEAAAPGQFARTLGAMVGVEEAPTPVAGAGAAPGVEGLLAVQGVADDSPEGRRRQAYGHGNRRLDALKTLQHRLVAGALSPDELASLARLTAEPRPAVDDPGLRDVLDEIDVRLQVELAKRRTAR